VAICGRPTLPRMESVPPALLQVGNSHPVRANFDSNAGVPRPPDHPLCLSVFPKERDNLDDRSGIAMKLRENRFRNESIGPARDLASAPTGGEKAAHVVCRGSGQRAARTHFVGGEVVVLIVEK